MLETFDGRTVPVAQIVEMHIYTIVTKNQKDYLSYKADEGHENQLGEYLNWGYNRPNRQERRYKRTTRKHTEGDYRFQNDKGLPVIFNYIFEPSIQLKNYPKDKPISDPTLRSMIHPIVEEITDKTKIPRSDGPDIRTSAIIARTRGPLTNKGGQGAVAGGNGILTRSGDVPGTNGQPAEKAVIHEMGHLLFSYNLDELWMGKNARRHNNPKLGGGGLFSYNSNRQLPANPTNVNMIIETVPEMPSVIMTPSEASKDKRYSNNKYILELIQRYNE